MTQTGSRQSELLIAPASVADLEQILQLEEACFSAPWTRKMLEAELSGNQFAHFLIAKGSGLQDETDDIAGYVCFWVVFEELRIMNLAIKASARRRGIARQLVTRTLEIGLERGASRALLEVRASNDPALLLYERMGFCRVAIRNRYYSQPLEDAILMEMEPLFVPTPSDSQHPVCRPKEIQNGPSPSTGRCDMLTEHVIAERLRQSSIEFRELEESHHRLDIELAELQKRHVLTPSEEVVKKQLQKEKLAKKDKMAELIRSYPQHEDHSTVH
ncbi:MAG: ribosomal protein S18-alanine N-acetyltransferase [Nitrospiraceae bacterium]